MHDRPTWFRASQAALYGPLVLLPFVSPLAGLWERFYGLVIFILLVEYIVVGIPIFYNLQGTRRNPDEKTSTTLFTIAASAVLSVLVVFPAALLLDRMTGVSRSHPNLFLPLLISSYFGFAYYLCFTFILKGCHPRFDPPLQKSTLTGTDAELSATEAKTSPIDEAIIHRPAPTTKTPPSTGPPTREPSSEIFRSTIERTIQLPPPYQEIGGSVLQYFGVIARQKHPDIPIKVSIKPGPSHTTFRIETLQESAKTIEMTLFQYGRTLAGECSAEDLLSQEGQREIRELRNQLELAKAEIHRINQVMLTERKYSQAQITSLQKQSKAFLGIIGSCLKGRVEVKDSHIQELSFYVTSTPPTINEAVQSLTEALRKAPDLHVRRRTRALRLLKEIEEQATLPEGDRKSKDELRAAYAVLHAIMNNAGSAAAVWQTWGKTITSILGI